jgi:Mor family transcriptional regulator
MVMADIGDRIQTIAHEVAAQIMLEKATEISEEIAVRLEQRLRTEMAGDRGYISIESTISRKEKHDRVRRMFNGRNATEIARELNIGRSTVYRILKTPGR